ncbi:unnamed protein product [Rotaria magnacalcarata]|uniref:Uncharacterized protein n=1 Tax=Rotaria magnacalcarata TaxID=392030 RepID=A0A8S3J9D5_9BILA|nr:unnamed protein product [Rotaria magnacalcarata]CAF5213246.1 unnamed protein product [Rotaria magnacalcarata]
MPIKTEDNCFSQILPYVKFIYVFLVRTRFGTRAKFEMVEVAEEPAAAAAVSKPVVSSFPTTAPTVTSAVLKAQRKKSSKKNK